MFFDTREPAPLSVRWARVIAPLVMCFAYTVFRVYPAAHERIPLSELLSAGAMFAGLVLVAFLALGDLIVPRLGRYPAPTVEEEPAPEDAFDWGRIEGDLLATAGGYWPGRADVKAELIKRAYGFDPNDAVTEELFTHEYVPQHHTPARGFAAPGWDGVFRVPDVKEQWVLGEIKFPNGFRLVGDHGEGIELDQFGQRTGGGRHALKDGE